MYSVKTAIYASIVWFVVSLAVAAGLFWYITTHPMGPLIDEARFASATEGSGWLMMTGIGGIWMCRFVWSKMQELYKKDKWKPR